MSHAKATPTSPADPASQANTATLDLPAVLSAAVTDPAQVRTRPIDRYALASDASHFALTPSAVVMAKDAQDVARLMRTCAEANLPLTLRAGGTSLSGQAVTDGILVDVRQHFRDIEILDDGTRVRLQPGLTLAHVNARLRRFGRRLGPDPASEVACTVGGIVANNSSGMACGTIENSYNTLESLVLVLPSGTVLDSGAADADAYLQAKEPELFEGLARLRDRVRANPASVATIAQQFAMKNTMGYGLNALIDHDSPAQILAHLAIGSEGTLGFVAQMTMRTVPIRQHVTSALAVFDSLHAATESLPALVESGAATLELLDATSLQVGQSLPDHPAQVGRLQVDRHAALLVEYQSTQAQELADLQAIGDRTLADLPLTYATTLSTEAGERAKLWKLRKGLYASVAGARPSGTTALLEDVVVPVPTLARTCEGLTDLFATYSYSDCVIFGHAKDGNVHFMLTDRFESDEQLGRYHAFTEDMVDLILGEGGSLKAEHGTGRVMAPYVRRQYGDELYDVMRQIKTLCDPRGTLNPGIILNDDPEAHLRHIKLSPQVESEVDRCVECGFCEPVCPSRRHTLTPRQRIVARRAMVAARDDGDTELAADLTEEYTYDAIDSCAADGMCQVACPVLINTGDLMKRFRAESASKPERAAWNLAAKHWSAGTAIAASGLSAAKAMPAAVPTQASRAGRAVLGSETVPQWSPDLPGGGRRRARDSSSGTSTPTQAAHPDAIYLPACVNAMFGPTQGAGGVQVSFEALCQRAGITLLVPDGIDSLCCGTPWTSKGYLDGAASMARRVREAVAQAQHSAGRPLPVISDASSCTEGFVKQLRGERSGSGQAGDEPVPIEVIDVVAFVAQRVLPLLPEAQRLPSLTLHPTCSSTQLGTNEALAAVGAAVADDVVVPDDWGCCAFAGDRGMLHPELTASATELQAAQVREADSAAHGSCNRTCEIGMSRATGKEYRHVIELLDEATRP